MNRGLLMPQILKEDVRDRIENSALDVLLEKGMRDTDMRSIAQKAGVTPGNLYRYFENKDQLIVSLTKPLLDSINSIVWQETDGELALGGLDYNFPKVPKGIPHQEYIYGLAFTKLTSVLLKIAQKGKESPKRMRILLSDTVVSEKLKNWVIELVTKSFNTCFVLNTATEYQANTMIKIFVLSFCEGALHLLRAGLETDIENFEKMMRRFVNMQLNAIMSLLSKEVLENTILLNREVFQHED